MHFYFIPKTMLNGHEYETTFHFDFDIADHFGIKAVKDTFNRAFNEWKDDIKYLTELSIVMNNRCWFWYEQGNEKLSQLYADYYYKTKNYAYENDKFTDDDKHYYFEMTD